MSSRPYPPREGSLADKVLGWLEHNGGQLSVQEISELFNRPTARVYEALLHTVQSGLLVKSSIRASSKIYYTLP